MANLPINLDATSGEMYALEAEALKSKMSEVHQTRVEFRLYVSIAELNNFIASALEVSGTMSYLATQHHYQCGETLDPEVIRSMGNVLDFAKVLAKSISMHLVCVNQVPNKEEFNAASWFHSAASNKPSSQTVAPEKTAAV